MIIFDSLASSILNDGSTDTQSLEIAKAYTLKDPRFTLFDKKNRGQASARNVGIEYYNWYRYLQC